MVTFGAPLVAGAPTGLHEALCDLIQDSPVQFHSYVHNMDLIPRLLGPGPGPEAMMNQLAKVVSTPP